MSKEKLSKSLEEIIKELDKQYGKGSVLNGSVVEQKMEVISTGSIGLDLALGVGGLPLGKIVEIIGWESTGKSTLTQTIIGNAQKSGYKCLLVDGENSLDEKYSKSLGINLNDLLLVQLDEFAGEGAYNRMEKLIESGEIQVVVIDSYNSLQPLSVVQGDVGESAIGKHARMLGQVVVKANTLSTKHKCLFIFVGQLREKIGVMFSSPETTQGGNALKFYSHIRLQVSRSTSKANTVLNGEEKIGNKTTVKVIKNKLSIPFKSADFNILYGVGIDKIQEIIDIADSLEILKIYGKTITYNEQKYKEEEFYQLLQDNEPLYLELKEKIVEKPVEILIDKELVNS